MICFFSEDITFNLQSKMIVKKWLKQVAEGAGYSIGDLNYIFCSDSYLLEMNKQYLGHDYFTDIITFDYCEGNVLSGDLFISIDTVRDNASFYGADSFENELQRVMVHGLLHLIGYDDHTPEQQAVMREKENYYLDFRAKVFPVK